MKSMHRFLRGCYSRRVGCLGLAVLLMLGVMGGDCDIQLPDIVLTGSDNNLPLVTVELVNTSDFFVDPFLFVDSDENASFLELIQEANGVVLDPPELAPGELVQVDFRCEDIGTAITDRALLFDGPDEFEADNSPVVRYGDDFICGDLISYIFVDDLDTGEFFVRVEINGQFLTDQ